MSEPLPLAAELHARGRVYGLLAQLILRGLDADRLATLEAIGWLVPPSGELGEPELDELAADHHRTFALELHPYAGVFLDPQAQAGAWSEQVRAHYERAGFRPRLDELAADHLGIELAFASFVSAAAGEAFEDGHAALGQRLLAQLLAFFDEALLSWLPILVAAAEGLGDGYWSRVLAETLELVAEHRAALADTPGLERCERAAPELPPGEDILADDRTGLRRVAEQLLVPARSGLALTRADIGRLGRGRSLPRGFGSRLIMLDNLMRSAVDYAQLDELLADLRALVDARDASYAERCASLGLGPALDPWRAALSRTRTLIDTIAAATPSPPSQSCTSKPSTTTPPAP